MYIWVVATAYAAIFIQYLKSKPLNGSISASWSISQLQLSAAGQ